MQQIRIVKLPVNRWKEYKAHRLEALQKDPVAFGSSYEEEKDISEKDCKKRLKTTIGAFYKDELIGDIVIFSSGDSSLYIL